MFPRARDVATEPRSIPGLLVEPSGVGFILGELERLFEVAARLHGCGERCSALPRSQQRRAGASLDLRRIRSIGRRLVRLEVMGCEDLYDLVFVRPTPFFEQLRSRQMARLAFLLRHGLVRDSAHDVLQEAVLASLGRSEN